MAKDLLLPGSILSLHRSAVEKLLKAGNGDAALLYLCLTAGQNSGALPWGPDQVEAAQNTLLRLGLISSDTPVQPPRPEKLEDDRPPDYTTQDIAQAFQNDGLQGPGAGGGAEAGEGPLPRRPQDSLHPL